MVSLPLDINTIVCHEFCDISGVEQNITKLTEYLDRTIPNFRERTKAFIANQKKSEHYEEGFGAIEVVYKKDPENHRFFPETFGTALLSPENRKKYTNSEFIEIDVENCYPVIIDFLFRKHLDVEYKIISTMAKNRDIFYKELISNKQFMSVVLDEIVRGKGNAYDFQQFKRDLALLIRGEAKPFANTSVEKYIDKINKYKGSLKLVVS